jgi:SNF2 family DNA or RNA helicase
MASKTGTPDLGDDVHPLIKQSGTPASSVTLDFSTTQLSDPKLSPKVPYTEASASSSVVGSRPRSRLPETVPLPIPRSRSAVKEEEDETFHFSNSTLRDFSPGTISDDELVFDDPKTTPQFNCRLHQASIDSMKEEDPTNQQSGLNANGEPSSSEFSNTNPTLSPPDLSTNAISSMNMHSVAAAQQAMLQKNRAVRRSPLEQHHVNGINSEETEEEDNSWMYEATELDGEREDLISAIDRLKRRLDNGKITSLEKVKLVQLQKELLHKEKSREAAAEANDEEAEEEGLFIPEETREEIAQRHAKTASEVFRKKGLSSGSQDEDDDATIAKDIEVELQEARNLEEDEDNFASQEGVSKKKNPRRKPAKTAREVFERKKQDLKTKALRRAQKKKDRKSAKTSHQNRGKKASHGSKKAEAKSKVKVNKDMQKMLNDMGHRGTDGHDNIAQMFLDEITSGDQIADRLNDPFFNTAPGKPIFARRKDTQLQKLFENVPQDSNSKKAKSDKANLKRASQCFGFDKVKAVDGMWLVKGMKSSLHHHQLLGVEWMLSREFGEAPSGGLLADAMGLGKTVQMLACMLGNLPSDDYRKRGQGATLIVAPSSVINQWMSEISIHAEESVFPKIYHYTGNAKMSQAVIESLDIVITSYAVVMRQLPWPEGKEELEDARKLEMDKWLQLSEVQAQMKVLHKISWYRVVLDEAHAIKNHWARTSVACQHLKSKYKWCLTGTPLMNRLDE